MNPRIKSLWVAALRSGKYRQGKNALTNGRRGAQRRYCCLGVLCDVYAQETNVPVGRVVTSSSSWKEAMVRSNDVMQYLPCEVRDWATLKDSDPSIDSGCSASEANDDLNWNFNQIATAIEANL